MSFWNLIRKGSYVDMDYIYGSLSNSEGENPLDYEAFQNNRMEFYVVAANALTDQAYFFNKSDIRKDCYDILKASSSFPFVCKPYWINGIPYYDGALGDPVPVEKAFELGCERARRYNESVALAQEYAKQGKVLIIAPDDTCGVDTLRRDINDLQKLYQKGYHDAQRITAFCW